MPFNDDEDQQNKPMMSMDPAERKRKMQKFFQESMPSDAQRSATDQIKQAEIRKQFEGIPNQVDPQLERAAAMKQMKPESLGPYKANPVEQKLEEDSYLQLLEGMDPERATEMKKQQAEDARREQVRERFKQLLGQKNR